MMKSKKPLKAIKLALLNIALFMLSACGGGGESTPAPTPVVSYTVGGSISGLAATVVLQNNSGNDLSIAADGNFSFTASIPSGNAYSVTVKTQPSNPTQTCTVTNGSGSVTNSNILNIDVSCSTNRYVISYSVSGLSGSGLMVQNASNGMAVVGDGTYSFSSAVASGRSYDVYVAQQPSNPVQSCTVANASGVVTNANITAPIVTCITPPLQTPRFAYVANYNSTDISGYAVNAMNGELTPLSGSPFATSSAPNAIAVDPSGKFAYVANSNEEISAYSINTTTGTLTEISGSPFATTLRSMSIAVDPSGKFVYVANSGNGGAGHVSAYAINPTTGALQPVPGSPFAAGLTPYSVSVDPAGKFVYVANADSNNVSAFVINPTTGALVAVSGSPFTAGAVPFSVAIDPAGKFAYVPNADSIYVSAYSINTITGALTQLSGSPIAVGLFPVSIAIDPSGKFAFVAKGPAAEVGVFAIDSTSGALTEVTGSPFSTSGYATSITVDPSGNFAYVAHGSNNNVSAYAINRATGALTAVVGSPFVTGMGAISIVITGSNSPAPQTCAVPSGAGTTHVGVNSAETWTEAGSPHNLPFDITINAAVTIEPCAVVRIGAGKTVTIPQIGSITASGTATQPVTIEALTTGQAWASIRNLGGTLSLTHTVITDGGAPLNTTPQIAGAIHMQSSSNIGTLHLDNVEIVDSRSQGVYITDSRGFDATSQNLSVRGSVSFPVHVTARVIGSIPSGNYLGNGRDQIAISGSGGAVLSNQTMRNLGVPYHVGSGLDGGRLDVNSQVSGTVAVLTIEPGVTIQFPPGGTLKIDPIQGTAAARGALVAIGTPSQPIIFTSDQGSQSAAGDWLGISFGGATNSQSTIQHVRVEFAGGQSSASSDSCLYPGRTGVNDAAIRFFGPPQNQLITDTEIAFSARDGIDRGWRSDLQPDFLSTNTFTSVAGCKQSVPRTLAGACPVNPSCP